MTLELAKQLLSEQYPELLRFKERMIFTNGYFTNIVDVGIGNISYIMEVDTDTFTARFKKIIINDNVDHELLAELCKIRSFDIHLDITSLEHCLQFKDIYFKSISYMTSVNTYKTDTDESIWKRKNERRDFMRSELARLANNRNIGNVTNIGRLKCELLVVHHFIDDIMQYFSPLIIHAYIMPTTEDLPTPFFIFGYHGTITKDSINPSILYYVINKLSPHILEYPLP